MPRVAKGTLAWYLSASHSTYISFFSMAIGILNYPDLHWRFINNLSCTVPVGLTTPTATPESRDGHFVF